jgi:hypothetical protein
MISYRGVDASIKSSIFSAKSNTMTMANIRPIEKKKVPKNFSNNV